MGGRSAEAAAQTFYYSTAVDQSRHPDGLVVARLRQRGIAGGDGLAFVEYSAAVLDADGQELLPALVPAAVSVDEATLERANPGCPQRISLAFLLDEVRTLDPASFATEHLNVGDWPDLDGRASTIIDLDKWNALAAFDSKPVAPVTVGFDISPDRRRASVAIAGRRLDGRLHVEVCDSAEGTGWLVGRVKQLVEDHDPYAVCCDAAHELLADRVFQGTGLTPDTLDRSELAQACGLFVDAVEQGDLHHLGDQVLLDAIRGATTSASGGDAWVFSRRSSRVDISGLYAAVLALMAVRKMPAELDEIAIY